MSQADYQRAAAAKLREDAARLPRTDERAENLLNAAAKYDAKAAQSERRRR